MKFTISVMFPLTILITAVITYNVLAKPVIDTTSKQRVGFDVDFDGNNSSTNSTNSTRKEL